MEAPSILKTKSNLFFWSYLSWYANVTTKKILNMAMLFTTVLFNWCFLISFTLYNIFITAIFQHAEGIMCHLLSHIYTLYFIMTILRGSRMRSKWTPCLNAGLKPCSTLARRLVAQTYSRSKYHWAQWDLLLSKDCCAVGTGTGWVLRHFSRMPSPHCRQKWIGGSSVFLSTGTPEASQK